MQRGKRDSLRPALRFPLPAQDAVRLDRLLARAHRNVFAPRAFLGEAGLLEHARRRGVPAEARRVDALELEHREAVADYGVHRLGRVPAAPVRTPQPVAELRACANAIDLEADRADERGVLGALDREVDRVAGS